MTIQTFAQSRVAKCQIFNTDQNRQTRFYLEKSAQIATSLALHTYKTEFKIFANFLVIPNFLPQLAIFLHGYIHHFLHGYIGHIRDILQLCDHRCSAASCNDELRPPDLPADKMSTCAPRLITTIYKGESK